MTKKDGALPKRNSSTGSNSNHSTGNDPPQPRRQPRTSQRPKGRRTTFRALSDGSAANNEVISLLQQQGDQQLAAAKLRAKQGTLQPREQSSQKAPPPIEPHAIASSVAPKQRNSRATNPSATTTTIDDDPNSNHSPSAVQGRRSSQATRRRTNQPISPQESAPSNSSASTDTNEKKRAAGTRQPVVNPMVVGEQEFLQDVILERLEMATASGTVSGDEESKEEEQADCVVQEQPQQQQQVPEKAREGAPIPQGSMPGAFHVGSFASNDTSSSDDDESGSWFDDPDGSWKEVPPEDGASIAPTNSNEVMEESERATPEQESNDEENAPTPNDCYEGDFLVEATLVTTEDPIVQDTVIQVVPEPELVTAERLSDPYQPRDMLKSKAGRRWILGGACVCLLILIIVGIILGIVIGGQPSTTPAETGSPTLAPTSVEDVLPASTREAILDASTPQSKAYQWYLDDMEYRAEETKNSQFNSLQRFVLATIYYSTGGNTTWLQSSNWLKHDESECDWFTTFFGSICSAGPQIRRLLQKAKIRRRVQSTTGARTATLHYNRLSLFQNNLTGSIPPELYLLSYLDVFDPHTNAIGGTIPTELGLLKYVTLFQVFMNQLTGTVPTELGLLPRVKQLNLAFNQLTGTVPSELGQLSNTVTSLSISNNRLSGSLPSEIGLLTKCQELFFYNNPNLTGPVPVQIGAMTALTKIELDRSNLTGNLPERISLLSGLKTLTLNDNLKLTGSIPKSWGDLESLEALHLHNTNVSGKVPPDLCRLMEVGTLKHMVVDCDKVDCSPCRVQSCDCSQSTNVTSVPVDHNTSSSNQDTEETTLDPNMTVSIVVTPSPELVDLPTGLYATPPPLQPPSQSNDGPFSNTTLTTGDDGSLDPNSTFSPYTEVWIEEATSPPELVDVPPGLHATPPPLPNDGQYSDTTVTTSNNGSLDPNSTLSSETEVWMEVVTSPPEVVEMPPLVTGDEDDNFLNLTSGDNGSLDPNSPLSSEPVETPPPELVVGPELSYATPPPELVPDPELSFEEPLPEVYDGAYNNSNPPNDSNESSSNQQNPDSVLPAGIGNATPPPEMAELPENEDGGMWPPTNDTEAYDNAAGSNGTSSSNQGAGTELGPDAAVFSEMVLTSPPELVEAPATSSQNLTESEYPLEDMTPPGQNQQTPELGAPAGRQWIEYPDHGDVHVGSSLLPEAGTAVAQVASTNNIFDHSSS